jgi:HrpA-like RNA helicase
MCCYSWSYRTVQHNLHFLTFISGNPILVLRDYTIFSAKKRSEYSQGDQSDLIAALRAYRLWQLEKPHKNMFFRRKWCSEMWLSHKVRNILCCY